MVLPDPVVVESVVLFVPDVPLELPLRLRRDFDLLVVELVPVVLLGLFWSIVVLDWPVCDALD